MVMVGLTAGLLGMVMFSEAASVDKNQDSYQEAPKPIHATNIKIAKKIPASLVGEDVRGVSEVIPREYNKPDFSERVATGVLGPIAIGNKYAVVIGICDYPEGGEISDICLSDGDSYNMVTALIENYGYDPENIYWFRDMGGKIDVNNVNISYGIPTHENIGKAVMEIKNKISPNDEVVFFFSGHGVSGTVNDGTVEYENDGEIIDEGIVVHDSDGEMDGDGYSTLDFIWDGELRSWFYDFGTERIVFIFDTCLAGGMNDVTRDENNEIYSNRIIVMSSEETQSSYVFSYGDFGEGMFSRHFVNEGMLQGLADGYNQIQTTDGNVAVEEAFDYAKENMPSYLLKFRQTPVISDMFDNDLVL